MESKSELCVLAAVVDISSNPNRFLSLFVNNKRIVIIGTRVSRCPNTRTYIRGFRPCITLAIFKAFFLLLYLNGNTVSVNHRQCVADILFVDAEPIAAFALIKARLKLIPINRN